MRKKTLHASENYNTQCRQINEIVELLEATKHQVEKFPIKRVKDLDLDDLIKDLTDTISFARSVRHQLLSTGRVPARAFDRLIDGTERIKCHSMAFI